MAVSPQFQRSHTCNIPVKWVMVLPFVVQIVGTLGLVSSLSNYYWTICICGIMLILSMVFSVLANRWISQVIEHSDLKHTEEALRQSEAILKSFLDNAPIPISIKDLEGTYLSINNEFTYWMQRPREEILGKKDQDFFPDEVIKRLRSMEKQAIFEEISISFEQTVQLPDGAHTFIMTKFPIIDDQNKVQTLAGIYLDISDRKREEMELAYNHDLREVIYNDSPDAIFLVDPFTLLIFDCNRRAVEMFEADSKQELIGIEGQTLQKYKFTDDQLKLINDEIEKFGYWSQETEYITKKGKHFWGNLAAKMIIVAGREMNLVRVTDISDRKRAEIILQESEARFQKIANISPEVIFIFVLQPNGLVYFEYVSVASEEVFSITRDDLIRNPDLTLSRLHPDDVAAYQEAFQKSLLNMEIFQHEWRIITPQGVKWIKAQSRPELRTNGDVAWYGFAFDISDRKKVDIALAEAEASLREANQELEKLINLDGLTQIANRRCFNHRIDCEWQRLHREQESLSLLMFDVDYFKHYNDCYGHQLGDECLIQIAQATKELIHRPADLVARYGGEEFIIILPNTNAQGALSVANQIHTVIRNLHIPHQRSPVSKLVSVSIGIACSIPNLKKSPNVLINQADQALYSAKQQGRNRSILFTE